MPNPLHSDMQVAFFSRIARMTCYNPKLASVENICSLLRVRYG
jgi:hypothetical protein